MVTEHEKTCNKYEEEIIKIEVNSQTLEEYTKYWRKFHPKAKKDVLWWCGKKRTGVLPSWNVILNVSSRIMQDSRKKELADYYTYVLHKQNIPQDKLLRCSVVVKHYQPTLTSFDLDNISGKAMLDSISKYGTWLDDNYKVVKPYVITGGYDKNNPRTEILILPITDEYDEDFVLNFITRLLK